MAVATAAHFADDCAALVTESAQSFVEDRTLTGIRAARAAFEQPGQVERLERYHGAKARWVLDAWIGTWLDPVFAGPMRVLDEVAQFLAPSDAVSATS
jgi:hypothetical protein